MNRASGGDPAGAAWLAVPLPPWAGAVWAVRPAGTASPASITSASSHRLPILRAEVLNRLTSPRGPVEPSKDCRTGAVLFQIEGSTRSTRRENGTHGLVLLSLAEPSGR